MTAADDGLRAALAEAMVQHQHHRCSWSGCGEVCYFEELADALLPTVRAAMDRRAAWELEAAANVFARGLPSWHETDLRARAAALRGEAGR